MRVSEACDRVGALIVRKEEEDIGSIGRTVKRREKKDQQEAEWPMHQGYFKGWGLSLESSAFLELLGPEGDRNRNEEVPEGDGNVALEWRRGECVRILASLGELIQ